MHTESITLPAKNTPVATGELIMLCEFLDMPEEAEILRADPPKKVFVSDGASGCPDFLSEMVYEAAFRHDLRYYLGGTPNQREKADKQFRRDLIKIHHLPRSVADFMYQAVRIGGSEELPTSWRWGFGRD